MPFHAIKRLLNIPLVLGLLSTISAIVQGNNYSSSACLMLGAIAGLTATNLVERGNK